MNNEVFLTFKHLIIYRFVLSWIDLVPEERGFISLFALGSVKQD